MITEILIFITTFLFVYNWQRTSKWNHLPGFGALTSFPIIGHGFRLGQKPCLAMEKFSKRFGNIFRLDVGMFPTVFLRDYDDALEVSV